MNDNYCSEVFSFAASKNLNISYSSPVITNGSLTPPSTNYPGLRCYYVSLTVGDSVFGGFGPSPSIARYSAEQKAYKALCSTKKVVTQPDILSVEALGRHNQPTSVSEGAQTPYFSLSQSSNVIDQLSQLYEDSLSFRKNEEDDFELYALSDSDEDEVTGKKPVENNIIYYSIAKSKEEVLSAFCNPETASCSSDEDDCFCFVPQFPPLVSQLQSNIEAALLQTAAEKGLAVSIKIIFNSKLNMYVAKAIAGSHVVTHRSVKYKIAKRYATSKLLDILTSKPACLLKGNKTAQHIKSSKNSSMEELPMHFLSQASCLDPPKPPQQATPTPTRCSQQTKPTKSKSQVLTPVKNCEISRVVPISARYSQVPSTTKHSNLNGYTDRSCSSKPKITCGCESKHSVSQPDVPYLSLSPPDKPKSFVQQSAPTLSLLPPHPIVGMHSVPSTSIGQSVATDDKFIRNPIGLLQELMMKQQYNLPVYVYFPKCYGGSTSYECTVKAAHCYAKGCGLSKQEACKKAAQNCLIILEQNGVCMDVVKSKASLFNQ